MKIGMLQSKENLILIDDLKAELKKKGVSFETIIKRGYQPIKKDKTIDFYHAQFLGQAYAPALQNIPFIITTHRGDVVDRPKTLFWKKLNKFAIKKARKVICVSNYTLKKTKEWADPGNLIRIYNAVSPKKFSPNIKSNHIRKELKLSNKPIILTFTSLIPRKGILESIEAIKKIPKDFYYLIGGQGPLKDKVIEEIGNDKRIILLDQIPKKDVRYYYALADIFCLHTYNEGHCGVILEAMSSECAVVTTSIPPNKETIIHNKEGLLSPPGDVNAMSSNIKKLLDNKVLRTKLGKNARRKIKESFSWEKIIPQYLKVYKEVL